MFEKISPEKRPAIRTQENGVPVYALGYAGIYGAPPDLTDEHGVQLENNNPHEKITLKKSYEIKDNYIGVCTTRTPRLPENDYQPLQVMNLIDGNPDTCWCSRPHMRSDEYPIWVRIDLASEALIHKVILKKRPITFDRSKYKGSVFPRAGANEIGRAMAEQIQIKVSRDAYSWEMVFDGSVCTDGEEFEFSFTPIRCKQLTLSADRLTLCENWCYSFSMACLEVCDEQDRNIALLSKGAGITTNSCNPLGQQELDSSWWYWPAHIDLGVKWSRIGYHDDMINWHWVEKEKGKLSIDNECEKAIDMLVENGINVVYCLNFGNRLYEGYPERRLPQLNEWYYETPFPPKNPEALDAWDNFVRFSVNHFNGHVKYFEIWNEWNGEEYWGDVPDVDHYIALVKRTIPIVRECAPDSKIMLGSFAQFVHAETPDNCGRNIAKFYKAIDELAPLVDIIGFHPFYQPSTESEKYRNYPENVAAFKRHCESRGFKGNAYMASEFAVGAMYPPTLPDAPGCWWGDNGRVNYSEIQKAKLLAQLNVRHAAMGIQSLYCELSSASYPLELSLFRKGFDSYPMQAMNPNAAYYVTRNLCTIMESMEPTSFAYELSGADIESWCLKRENALCCILWARGEIKDYCTGRYASLTVNGKFAEVYALNPINGERTSLKTKRVGDSTLISGILVRDFPLFVILQF